MARAEEGMHAGFGAVSEDAPLHDDNTWWLINQERDESGRLRLELQEAIAMKTKVSEELDANVGMATRLMSELQAEMLVSERRAEIGCSDAVDAQKAEVADLKLQMDSERREHVEKTSVAPLQADLQPSTHLRDWLCDRENMRSLLTSIASGIGSILFILVCLIASVLVRQKRALCLEQKRRNLLLSEVATSQTDRTALAAELEDCRKRVVLLEKESDAALYDAPMASSRPSRKSGCGVGGHLSEHDLDFGYHIKDTEVDRETMRLIKIQCLGVTHAEISVDLVFNGCEVTIQRRASCGVDAITWKRKFQFRPNDGIFEFKEDQMQLEHGFLHLVFRAYRFQTRTIRFPQHFPLASTDADIWWDYPEDEECAVQPSNGRQSWPRKIRTKDSHTLLLGRSASHVADTESTASTPRNHSSSQGGRSSRGGGSLGGSLSASS